MAQVCVFPNVQTVLLLFLVVPLFVYGQTAPLRKCRVSADCALNRRCSLDFCPPFSNVCVNVNVGRGNCPGTDPSTSKEEILAELNRDPAFTVNARLTIIDAAITLLRDVHPHRNFHLNFLRYDPVQRLTQLRRRVLRPPDLDNAEFHAQMLQVFLDLDDAHSQYRPPPPLADTVAFLPFTITDFYDPPLAAVQRRVGALGGSAQGFVVSDLANGFVPARGSFRVGVEVVEWNRRPIQEAIRDSRNVTYGANEFAKFRAGLEALTSRALPGQPLPALDSVEIGYIDGSGRVVYVFVDWVYVTLRSFFNNNNGRSLPRIVRQGARRNATVAAREFLSSRNCPRTKNMQLRPAARQMLQPGRRRKVEVNPALSLLFDAEIVGTRSGTYGYIKIFTFDFPNFSLFAAEYARLLNLLPPEGVVVDIRRNRGGFNELEYLTLLLISNKTFVPSPSDVRATPLIQQLAAVRGARQDEDLAMFLRSIRSARVNGATFSTEEVIVPIDPFLQAQGAVIRPTIILTDGITYSAGDGVTSSAKDNGLAVVVGVDGATGGGGSTVVQYEDLRAILPRAFPALPGDIGFTISLLRTLRVGKFRGVTYEFFGVQPNLRYFPTYADRTENERDLIEFLGEKLEKLNAAAAAEIARGNPVR